MHATGIAECYGHSVCIGRNFLLDATAEQVHRVDHPLVLDVKPAAMKSFMEYKTTIYAKIGETEIEYRRERIAPCDIRQHSEIRRLVASATRLKYEGRAGWSSCRARNHQNI
jgi:hypothetical protein